ncbi:MAG: RNA polymerase factor sigma-54 [Oligosphaeraceae bacterium]|nr:RNA polymerase factor sigma-54 [Oligosphaeraceae bacterium]
MQLHLGQNLNISQRQEQVMAPQQLQSLEILQATSLELEQKLLQEIQINPLLELIKPANEVLESNLVGTDSRNEEQFKADLAADIIEKDENLSSALLEDLSANNLDNFSSDFYSSRPDAEVEERRRYFFDSITREPSFHDLLAEQIFEQTAEQPELRALTLQLAGYLDSSGYLTLDVEELALACDAEPEQVQAGIRLLQSFYPPGLAARDLRECLLLQLAYYKEKGSIAWDIVDRHLEDLARNRLPLIAEQVDADLEEVQEALQRIRKLAPRPASLFDSRVAPSIAPDLRIDKNEFGQWTVQLNYEVLPRVIVNEEYLEELKKQCSASQDQKYLRDKEASARQLLWAVDQRQSTLSKIGEALIMLQSEFLEEGVAKLKPLIMAEVAELLELHETTISRAVANKYVQTPQGLFPLKFFFSSGYSSKNDGEEVSSRAIKQRIVEIINQENPYKPLSDQKISEALKKQGFQVARRTVAKYREEEDIPAASLRKVHK